jgi:acyl dehydratase
MSANSRYGGYLEDFTPGDVYRHWPGRTIADYDNVMFSLLSMNQNPLFLDKEYAARLGDGRTPVVDTLVFSLTVGMSVADITGRAIANLGYESVEFEQPLFPGDTLYAESEILEKRASASRPDRGVVRIETRAFNQKKERILVLRRSFLVSRRNHEPG